VDERHPDAQNHRTYTPIFQKEVTDARATDLQRLVGNTRDTTLEVPVFVELPMALTYQKCVVLFCTLLKVCDFRNQRLEIPWSGLDV